MHYDAAVLKLKQMKAVGKKKALFWTTFFYRSLKLVHLQLHLLGKDRSLIRKDSLLINIF